MATITAAMVKELREKSGAGMMDCKNALNETDGDMDAAVDWLRAKGLASAAKKAGRVAAEGLVGVAFDGGQGAVVEVNSETDFVALTEPFQEMVTTICDLALEARGDKEALSGTTFPGSDKKVDEYVTEMVGTIGENLSFRRVAGISVDEGVVAAYVHNQVAPGLGKIGVLVGLKSSGDADKLSELGKQVAMHIAATNPLAITSDELPQDVVERERAVLIDQARGSGKPENIIEKMIEGRMHKYYKEVALLSQTFVIDGENTVEKALKAAEKDVGGTIEVVAFERFALGEGIEKKEDDFAAEVAAAASGS